MKIIFDGEFTTLNEYIKAERSNKYLGAKIKREETERVVWQTKSFLKKVIFSSPGKEPFKYALTFHWYRKNSKSDPDNIAFAKKFVLDGLVLAGMIPEDSWKYIVSFSDHFFISKSNPRVEVEINIF